MGTDDTDDATAAGSGDPDGDAVLFEALYEELRQVAGRVFRSQRQGHTLSPTVLVHEAWLKIARPGAPAAWHDRAHVLNLASRAMRQVLLNHARGRAAQKRGGPQARRVTLEGLGAEADAVGLLDLHEALAYLERLDARQGRLAQLRLLGGLGLDEIAVLLGVGKRTAELDWRMAKQTLAARLRPPAPSGA